MHKLIKRHNGMIQQREPPILSLFTVMITA